LRAVTWGFQTADVDPLRPVPIQVPARPVAHLGEEGVDAGLGFRVGGHVFDFVALQADRVEDLDIDGAERAVVMAREVSNREVVERVHEEERQKRPKRDLQQ
jgi:hypothetical protein